MSFMYKRLMTTAGSEKEHVALPPKQWMAWPVDDHEILLETGGFHSTSMMSSGSLFLTIENNGF